MEKLRELWTVIKEADYVDMAKWFGLAVATLTVVVFINIISFIYIGLTVTSLVVAPFIEELTRGLFTRKGLWPAICLTALVICFTFAETVFTTKTFGISLFGSKLFEYALAITAMHLSLTFYWATSDAQHSNTKFGTRLWIAVTIHSVFNCAMLMAQGNIPIESINNIYRIFASAIGGYECLMWIAPLLWLQCRSWKLRAQIALAERKSKKAEDTTDTVLKQQ
jgi:hypothetical protein